MAGKPTYFLRVGGCDYACVWCDSDHAVLPEKVRGLERLTQAQIIERLIDWIVEHPGPIWLTISGGNPAMYDLAEVVIFCHANGMKTTVETQGSRRQPWLADVDCLTISPKPPSSEMPRAGNFTSLQTLRNFMEYLEPRANPVLKVVVFDNADYEFAQTVHKTYPLVPFYLSCGTAMGGLSGRWVPPAIPGLGSPVDRSLGGDFDYFWRQRRPDGPLWPTEASAYTEPPWHLLLRYRWLAERTAADPLMADVAVLPQLHALAFGIETRGV